MKKNSKNIKEQSAVCWLLFFFVCKHYIQSLVNVKQTPRIITFVICWMIFSSLFGQTINSEKLKEIAIGPSIIHEKLPEGYDYTPLFFTTRIPLYQFSSERKGRFNVFAEPQFIFNNAPQPFNNTFEFGANLGVQFFLPLSAKNGLSFSISAGPHYLSLETEIQAKGFIFSDNFEIGYYHKVSKKLGISIKPRFRHISNAGFQSPNIGIDNLFLMVGVFWN